VWAIDAVSDPREPTAAVHRRYWSRFIDDEAVSPAGLTLVKQGSLTLSQIGSTDYLLGFYGGCAYIIEETWRTS